MRSNTPRYVFPSKGDSTFEFPVIGEHARTPVATVAVAANTFDAAIVSALEWAVKFSEKASDDHRFFPQVAYSDSRRLVKKVVDGYAWVENHSHGAWVPVARLAHAAAVENVAVARKEIAADNAASGERIRASVAKRMKAAKALETALNSARSKTSNDPAPGVGLSPQQRAWVTIRARRAAAQAAK